MVEKICERDGGEEREIKISKGSQAQRRGWWVNYTVAHKARDDE